MNNQTQKMNKYPVKSQGCCNNTTEGCCGEVAAKPVDFAPLSASIASIRNSIETLDRLRQMVSVKEDQLFGRQTGQVKKDCAEGISKSVGQINDLAEVSSLVSNMASDLEQELSYLLERIK